MAFARNAVRCLAVGVVSVLALAACSSGKGGGSKGSNPANPNNQGQKKGGTLYYDNLDVYSHLDPQRIYIGLTLAFATRTMFRTLTTFAQGEGTDGTTIVPDMATDLGQRSADAKTWTFTLKPNVKWQDGQAVTCADFKYGISRTFAADDGITAGPTYALDYLNIPRAKDGGPDYKGPYHSTPAQQALYDKSIDCPAANKIVFHLRHPVADFDGTLTMTAFAPVRKDKDTVKKMDNEPFSDGPYKLEGSWDLAHGGTLVRNPEWDPSSDSIRKDYPDKIVTSSGDTAAVIAQKLIADNGNAKNTVTVTPIPPSNVAQVYNNKELMKRAVVGEQTFVDYLSINVKKVPDRRVRQAIAMAIDKTAYVTAWGGATAGVATNSVISPALPAYTKYDAFDTGDKGNTNKAKALLEQAGKVGMHITYEYRKTEAQDKAAASIKANLEAAGFKVTVSPLGYDQYYDIIANPSQTSEVVWTSWGADWPSASTVIPPLFDGRTNISSDYLGNDYAEYNDPETNKAMDTALQLTDNASLQQAWSTLDQKIVKDAVVVPLMADKAFFIHGSNVKGFNVWSGFGGYADPASLAVQ